MAQSLEQVKNILDGSVASINRYTNAFNKMSSTITNEVTVLDTSIEELKAKLNSLYTEANKLGDIGKNIKNNDTEQINKYAESVNKLDSAITELLPDIASGFEAVNNVIASKFKDISGNTGELKAELNRLVSEFSTGISAMNATKLDVPVSLGKFSKSIKEQVDKIEYEMGRLTMFTNTRDMEELSLGFKINQNDIDDAVNKQKEKIKAIKNYAQEVEYEHGEYYNVASDKLTPQFLKDYEDKAKEFANIQDYIAKIKGSKGKNVKGYLDLFNEASTLLNGSKPFMDLLEASSNVVNRASYPNISNWKNATVDDILKANKQDSNGLDALLPATSTKSNSTKNNSDLDSFDKMVISAIAEEKKQTLKSNETKSREDFVNSTKDKLESIKNEEAAKIVTPLNNWFSTPKNATKDASEEVKKSSEEVKKSSEEVKKSLESIKKELNEASNAYDKSASSVKNYTSELNNLLEKDKSLSDEVKESILSRDNSSAINKYTSNLNHIQKDLNDLGNIELEDAPALKLGNTANGVRDLNNYKISIKQAKSELENLIERQEKEFKLLSDPSTILGKSSININTSSLNSVRSVLESGYKVNLVDGSAAKNEFDELETEFKQFINNYKTFKLNILDTKQIDNLIKLNNITKEIQSVNAETLKHEKALADYENNKVKYAEKYKAIAQAESNIRAIERVKQSKISGSKYSAERETLAAVYDEVSSKQQSRISSLRREIEILENEFKKHGLEIPVVPKIARPLPSDSNFGELLPSSLQKDYMSLLKDNKNEFKSLLYNTDLDYLNKQASDLGINTDKINSRLSAIKNTISSLFNAGQTDKAKELVEVYNGEIDKLKDKVNGASKAQQINADRQKQAIKSLLEETKNYISTQEALNNKPMSYADQAAYYDQQLSKFKEGTKEYIEVLKLKNQAENKAADETQKAADTQARFGDELYRAKFEHTRNYVADQETLTGQKMPLQDQLEYYKSAIKQFESGSNEYVAILRLQRNVERQIEAQAQADRQAALDNEVRVAEERVRAEEEASRNRQKAYDKYAQQRQADAQTINSIRTQFGERESLISGMDTQGLDKAIDRIRILKTELEKALEAGNASRASAIWDAYIGATDKVVGKGREVEEAQKRQAEAEKAHQEAIKSLFEETKNYVSKQEALTNQPMAYSDQAAYYKQQLSKFEEGTREYIEVLKLKNQAENKAAEEAQKAAEKEEKAHLEALEAAKQRVTSILSTIKSFADGINSAVNKIVQIIRTGISLINKIISGATKFVVTIGRGIRSIITLFGNLGNRVKSSLLGVSEGSNKVNGSFNVLKGSATELRSKILLLKGAFDGLFNGELVKKAENLMASVYSLQNIAGSNTTQEVLDWANAMEYAFGLSAKELIGDINELTGVLYGLGMSAKDTALGSENILMMSRYLAFMGAAGGDTNAVMTKLVSGMKGMTQAIDDLGLSVRDAQMDAFLKSLKAQGGEYANIATDFSSLNEQARVYVRYASLIDQFTRNYDITNFADALTTVTGRMQILRQSVNSLVTTLGTGLTKVLANLATYLIPVIKLIEQLVTKIFAFFGIDVTMTTDINEGTAALSDLGDGLDDTKNKLDEVSDSAKKAGGNLQSFDRINNVTSSKSKSSKGGDDDFDYSKLMSSMLDNLNDLASKATVSYSDKLLENFKNKLAEMKQSLIDFAKDITGREDFNLGFDWSKIKENLKTVFDNIVATIKSWGSFVIEIGLKIADDVNIGLIITKLTELLAKISEVAKALTDVLIPAFRKFYDIALSKIVIYLGEQAVKAIDFTIEELDKWKVWLDENKDGIVGFFEDLANAASTAFDNIKPILDANWKSVGESISNANEKLREFLGKSISNDGKKETITNITSLWGEFLQILASLNSIAKSVLDIIIQLVNAFGEFAKEELIPWINEKLRDLSDWINENKDKIVDFITKIASATWEGFKIFVDLLGKLIDYVVQNPDSVFKFFEALIGLKVASWFTSTAASIGLALMGFKELASFASGAGSTLSGLLGGGAAGGAAGGGAAGALEAIGGAAGPIALVVAAVVALVAAIKDLWDTSESFRQAIRDTWDNIVEAFDGAKEKISAALGNIKEAWDNFYQAYENSGLKTIIEALVTLIAEYLGGAISGVITLIGNLFATIGNVLADIINIIAGVTDAFSGLIKLIGGVFELIFLGDADLIKQGWSELVTGLIEILQGLIQGIIDIISGKIGYFIDLGSALIGGLGKGISDAWQGFVESVRSLFDGWIKAVKEFFGIHSPSKVFAEIGDFLVQGLLQGIQDAWTAFSEAVIGLFEGLIKGIENTFSGIGEFFSTTFNNAKELAIRAWSNANEKFTEVKNKVASAFDGIKENIRTTFTAAKENAVSVWSDAKSRFTTVADNIASGLASIKSKAREIFVDVRNSASNILSDIGNQLSNAWDGVKTKVSSGWNYVTGNTKATTGRKITSHAVGGSIAGGQLFIANENGNAELIGNIDGSGKTNVANNNMIMQAMESGIFEAVYNAMAEVMNQRGTVGNSGNTTIKIDGFGLIDASTLRELARILAPYLRSNDINIADTQFSI